MLYHVVSIYVSYLFNIFIYHYLSILIIGNSTARRHALPGAWANISRCPKVGSGTWSRPKTWPNPSLFWFTGRSQSRSCSKHLIILLVDLWCLMHVLNSYCMLLHVKHMSFMFCTVYFVMSMLYNDVWPSCMTFDIFTACHGSKVATSWPTLLPLVLQRLVYVDAPWPTAGSQNLPVASLGPGAAPPHRTP